MLYSSSDHIWHCIFQCPTGASGGGKGVSEEAQEQRAWLKNYKGYYCRNRCVLKEILAGPLLDSRKDRLSQNTLSWSQTSLRSCLQQKSRNRMGRIPNQCCHRQSHGYSTGTQQLHEGLPAEEW